MTLKLEAKAQPDKTGVLAEGVGLISPLVNEDYWLYRVQVQVKPPQAVVAFPKFGIIGIGFQVEKKDWNTNLPWTFEAIEIYKHIECNSRGADRADCLEAIRMIQEAIRGTRE